MAPKRALECPDDQPVRRVFGPERPPPPVTETFVQPPQDVEQYVCNCIDNCAIGKSCSCQKWGGACKPTCACHGAGIQARCANILNHYNTLFFGEGTTQQTTACFKKYLINADRRRRKVTPAMLEKWLLKDIQDAADWEEDIQEWLQGFEEISADSPDRPAYMQKLFRLALSEDGSYYWFSFCNKSWEQSDTWTHCWTCDKCEPDKETWHCGVCNKCRDFPMEKCKGCGGVSTIVGILREDRKKGESTCACAWHSGPLPTR